MRMTSLGLNRLQRKYSAERRTVKLGAVIAGSESPKADQTLAELMAESLYRSYCGRKRKAPRGNRLYICEYVQRFGTDHGQPFHNPGKVRLADPSANDVFFEKRVSLIIRQDFGGRRRRRRATSHAAWHARC